MMISVIVGLYNEEEVLPSFIKTFFRDIRLEEDFELIMVDDGSKDHSKDIVIKFKKVYPQIKLISYCPNKGLGNALRTGFRNSKGRIIVTMDADLAHLPKYVNKLVQTIDEGYDLVIGSRYAKGGGIKEVPSLRHILSKLTNFIARIAIISNVRDATNNFRAYDAGKLGEVSFRANGFEVELELLVNLMKKGARIKEVPIRALLDREAGESTFSLSKDSFHYIIGLCRVITHRWI